MTGRPAVFLDRDGVLNDAVVDEMGGSRSPRTLAEFRIASDAPAEIARLRAGQLVPVVVTNQPDVARGKLTTEDADEMTRRLRVELGLELVYECRHDNSRQCACRKPRPGLLLDAAGAHDLDLARSWLIGDRWVDVAAARAAHVRPVLLERPWSWRGSSSGEPPVGLVPAHTARSLEACVDYVLGLLDLAAP